jgi:hypothetical protein
MSHLVKQLCAEVKLPRMIRVRQIFDGGKIEVADIPAAVTAQMSRPELADCIKSGMRIAITCGSRGITNVDIITKAIVDLVKSRGAMPFVVPAMGSHGGATAEGQKTLIESYGVTEEFIGCPILSSMETVVIGDSGEGHQVRIDKHAASADGIIVAGRIKPHTDFHGTYESGLIKMMAIGLGKREGADMCHQKGFGHMAHMVHLFGKTVLKNAPIVLGLGIMENAYSETCKIVALAPDEIEHEEPVLLNETRTHLPLIYFKTTDVLVVERIGKDIAGTGMDPNVTVTSPCTPYISEGGITALRTAILDLTDETHGIAFGMGAAHVITRRLFDKIDYDATYINAVTSRGVDFVRIPLIVDSDREAVQLALRTCIGNDSDHPRIVRVADSFHTEYIWISESMVEEAKANPRIEILSEPEEWGFDQEGNLW